MIQPMWGLAVRWIVAVTEADQQSFSDPPTRIFLLRARMFGLPVEAFHRLIGGRATMQVKIAGAIPMVDAHGAVMDRCGSRDPLQ
jgi:hypothetical protein